MREVIRQFVKICAETFPIAEPIYEFGSFQAQLEYSNLRPFFPNKTYIGADMREGPGVDEILNLHNIDLPSNHAGTVLCFDTLEHVEYLRRAIEETHRILKPGGILIISSVFFFRIHDAPSDYWRFTPDSFRSLLKPFKSSFVGYCGDPFFPHTVVGIGFKGSKSKEIMIEFMRKFKDWELEFRNPTGRWKGFLKRFIPPVLIPILSKINRKIFRDVDPRSLTNR